MDTASIASLATGMSRQETQQAVQLAVLKKAMDVQAQGAMQLIQSAAGAVPNNPPHLGNRVDTFA